MPDPHRALTGATGRSDDLTAQIPRRPVAGHRGAGASTMAADS